MNIYIKTEEEMQAMREGGKILGTILKELSRDVRSGVRLPYLEQKTQDLVKQAGGSAAFFGYMDYPCALCVSINEEIVHGLSNRDIEIKDGDIVSLDMGVKYKGMIVDSAVSVLCGEVDKEKERLIEVCRNALMVGIEQVRAGATTGDIGEAVQTYAEKRGYAVVRDLVGHGVGREVHEDPQIPNFGTKGGGVILEEGMTIALEPMITLGGYEVETLDDGWTIATLDRSLAAHFEHTVLVTKNGAEVLTNYE